MAATSRRFSDLCKDIRNNDPSIVEVEIPLRYRTKPHLLLQALHCSSNVALLILDLRGVRDGEFECASLLQYLKQCEYICAINLKCLASDPSNCFSELVGRIMQSLTENPSAKLITFECSAALGSTELIAFLQDKLHYLKRLSIGNIHVHHGGDEAMTEQSWRQISVAIGSLPILESLALECEFPSDNSIETMFARMKSLACLRTLRISRVDWMNNDAVIAALRSLLSSDVRLEMLELEYFELGKEMIEHLGHGLASCQSLVHLCLKRCDFRSFRFEPAIVSTLMYFLRNNGSLHQVSVPVHFCQSDQRLIQAWCERNRVAPRMLARLNLDTEAFDHLQTPVHLSPLLYKVGLQTPRMAPTWFLTGLLASAEAIGFGSNSKKWPLRE
jgi:hypothetical protein